MHLIRPIISELFAQLLILSAFQYLGNFSHYLLTGQSNILTQVLPQLNRLGASADAISLVNDTCHYGSQRCDRAR